MILTVTMNPSVDISYQLPDFKLDASNRVTAENVRKTAGGKGLNVTRVIHQLSTPVVATGIVGGTLGEYIEQELDKDGIQHDFAKIEQESRNCIAILHDGKQTEILEAGPTISTEDLDKFFAHFEKLLSKTSVVTISGSLPKGVPTDFYQKMIITAKSANKKVLLDSSGEALLSAISDEIKPDLIKPNQQELADIVGFPIENFADIKKGLDEGQKKGLFFDIPYVVISLGKDGAVLKYQNNYHHILIPEIKVANPVGSGDATIAGMAVAMEKQLDAENIVKYGMTTGLLNTMEAQTGFIQADLFKKYFEQIKIEKI